MGWNKCNKRIRSNTNSNCHRPLFTWMLISWGHTGRPSTVGAHLGDIAGLCSYAHYVRGSVRPMTTIVHRHMCLPSFAMEQLCLRINANGTMRSSGVHDYRRARRCILNRNVCSARARAFGIISNATFCDRPKLIFHNTAKH